MVLIEELPFDLAAEDVVSWLESEFLMKIPIINCLGVDGLEPALFHTSNKESGLGLFIVMGLFKLPVTVLVDRQEVVSFCFNLDLKHMRVCPSREYPYLAMDVTRIDITQSHVAEIHLEVLFRHKE